MSIAGLTVAGPVLDHAEDTGGAQTVVPGVRVYCDLLWIIGEAAVSGGNVIAGYGDVHVRAQGHGHTQRLHPERVVACCCRDLGRAPVTHLLLNSELNASANSGQRLPPVRDTSSASTSDLDLMHLRRGLQTGIGRPESPD